MSKNSPESGDRRARFYWWAGSLLWAVAAWWFLAPPDANWVERCFSLGWYRWILAAFTPLTQRTGFPIVLVLAPAIVAAFFFLWVRSWRSLRRAQGRPHHEGFLWGIRCIFMFLPLLLIWGTLFWGAGYRRLPVEERLRLDVRALPADEMRQFRGRLLEEVRRNLTSPAERVPARAVRSIASRMTQMVAGWDGKPIIIPERVKLMPKGLLLSSGTSGMCSPITLEALVDGGLPEAAMVANAAHELGHLAGFCAEDEASFAGYACGLLADDRFARYACALDAYAAAMRGLESGQRREALDALPDLARQDLREANAAFEKYRVAWISRISWRVYHRYLQAQGIGEGVENYSRGILLLACSWRQGMMDR